MSIRTAVEFNHDYHDKQTKNPLAFITALRNALYNSRDSRAWADLAQYGVTKVYDCHHSDDRIEVHKVFEQSRTRESDHE